MFKTVANAWKVPEFRKKIWFTLFVIVIFRIGSVIPVPFLDTTALAGLMNESAADGTALGYLNMMSGGAFASATLFALSITPYINASIIMNLLTIAVPRLERLARDGGEQGKRIINLITRCLTIAIAIGSGTGYYFFLANSVDPVTGNPVTMYNSGGAQVFSAFVIIATFTAGAVLLMWLGEQVNKRGVGNGISIILFAGIVARMPTIIMQLVEYFKQAAEYPSVTPAGQAYPNWVFFILAPIFIFIFFLLVWIIVFMNDSERKIPVQYAKRVVGRKQYGGQSSHIPIKIGSTGVMPVIFASSLLSIPSTIYTFIGGENMEAGFWKGFFEAFSSSGWLYCIVYAILIFVFAFFYMTIQYNPLEMANTLKQQHGTIPGIRPGRPTAEFISKVLSKLTFLGALFLVVICLIPMIYTGATGMGDLGMGGTSIIILVGVALETVKQIESQMMMRSYKGFLD